MQGLTPSTPLGKPITQLGWTMFPHPTYSPGLEPSEFQLFRPLKDAVCGRKLSRMMMSLASSELGCLQDSER